MIDDLGHSELVGSPFKNILSWEELQRKLIDFQESMKSADQVKLNTDSLTIAHCADMSDKRSTTLPNGKIISLS